MTTLLIILVLITLSSISKDIIKLVKNIDDNDKK